MATGARIVKDLGELTGDVLLFGGPYSNAHATRALLGAADRLEIPRQNRICTGDAVAYCADPLETIALLDGACEWLAGNCEKQLAASADACGCGFDDGSACDLLSRGWYPYADSAVGRAQRTRMASCPDLILFTSRTKRYAVVHGGYCDIARFLWPCSPVGEFEQEFNDLEGEVGPVDAVISGHSGMAFERNLAGRSWINAGAIGMPPHDGRAQTRFVVLNQDGARIKRLRYDVEGAVGAMRAAGLVQGYEVALETGVWPSDDILPQALRGRV